MVFPRATNIESGREEHEAEKKDLTAARNIEGTETPARGNNGL